MWLRVAHLLLNVPSCVSLFPLHPHSPILPLCVCLSLLKEVGNLGEHCRSIPTVLTPLLISPPPLILASPCHSEAICISSQGQFKLSTCSLIGYWGLVRSGVEPHTFGLLRGLEHTHTHTHILQQYVSSLQAHIHASSSGVQHYYSINPVSFRQCGKTRFFLLHEDLLQ